MKRQTLGIFLVFWAIFAGSTGLEAAPRYYYEDLGTLGGARSVAAAINNDGQVVGSSLISDSSDWHPFLKKPGLPMEDLGVFSGGYYQTSYAMGINGSGWIVGGAAFAGTLHAFLKKPGLPLQDLAPTEEWSWGLGINAGGQIVGDMYSRTYHDYRAFLITDPANPVPVDLGTLGGTQSRANAINDSGEIVGFATNGAGQRRAFLKHPGDPALHDLGTLGGATSQAHAINAGGKIVGEAETAGGFTHAFLKNPDAPNLQDLGTLGGTASHATGINVRDQIVGDAETSGGLPHAFLKNPGEPMQDLNNLTYNLPPGTTLAVAVAISNNGQIAGVADPPGHAFRLTPVDVLPPIRSLLLD